MYPRIPWDPQGTIWEPMLYAISNTPVNKPYQLLVITITSSAQYYITSQTDTTMLSKSLHVDTCQVTRSLPPNSWCYRWSTGLHDAELSFRN